MKKVRKPGGSGFTHFVLLNGSPYHKKENGVYPRLCGYQSGFLAKAHMT